MIRRFTLTEIAEFLCEQSAAGAIAVGHIVADGNRFLYALHNFVNEGLAAREAENAVPSNETDTCRPSACV